MSRKYVEDSSYEPEEYYSCSTKKHKKRRKKKKCYDPCYVYEERYERPYYPPQCPPSYIPYPMPYPMYQPPCNDRPSKDCCEKGPKGDKGDPGSRGEAGSQGCKGDPGPAICPRELLIYNQPCREPIEVYIPEDCCSIWIRAIGGGGAGLPTVEENPINPTPGGGSGGYVEVFVDMEDHEDATKLELIVGAGGEIGNIGDGEDTAVSIDGSNGDLLFTAGGGLQAEVNEVYGGLGGSTIIEDVDGVTGLGQNGNNGLGEPLGDGANSVLGSGGQAKNSNNVDGSCGGGGAGSWNIDESTIGGGDGGDGKVLIVFYCPEC